LGCFLTLVNTFKSLIDKKSSKDNGTASLRLFYGPVKLIQVTKITKTLKKFVKTNSGQKKLKNPKRSGKKKKLAWLFENFTKKVWNLSSRKKGLLSVSNTHIQVSRVQKK
jgi:hypothetical protein